MKTIGEKKMGRKNKRKKKCCREERGECQTGHMDTKVHEYLKG